MKILLSLCFIVLFLCTNAAAQAASDAVLDLTGEELKVGSKYYVVAAVFGAGGGGLTLSDYSGLECNTTVSQEPFDVNFGIPCSFHPATSGGIRESQSLNIQFETKLPCAASTVWRVGNLDAYTRAVLIKIGGVLGNPGCGTSRNWFKIEKGKFPVSYKIVWNPNDVCSSSSNESQNLIPRLALERRPVILSNGETEFEVIFIKLEESKDNISYKQILNVYNKYMNM